MEETLRGLRKKYTRTILIQVGILLSLILAAIGFFLYQELKSAMYRSLQEAVSTVEAEETGPGPAGIARPVPSSQETADSLGMRYTELQVFLYDSKTGQVTQKQNQLTIDSSTLDNAAASIAGGTEQQGVLSEYGLFYYSSISENGLLIGVAYTSQVMTALTRYLWMLGGIELLSLLVVYLISRKIARQAVAPLAAAMEEQKRFVADASHELKTPLAVMMANNSIVEAHGTETVASQKQWLESTDAEITQMSGLIQNMLLLSQTEELQGKGQLETVDLSTLLMSCALEFDAVAYEHRVELREEIAEQIQMRGEKLQLRSLAMTLLDNALRYEPEGGCVTVRLWKNKKEIVFQVHNRDSVIAPEDLEHIFERFYRSASGNASNGQPGFGLGLAIAENIVRRHGGILKAESSRGQGTAFTAHFEI